MRQHKVLTSSGQDAWSQRAFTNVNTMAMQWGNIGNFLRSGGVGFNLYYRIIILGVGVRHHGG